jgi:hypothetical protein
MCSLCLISNPQRLKFEKKMFVEAYEIIGPNNGAHQSVFMYFVKPIVTALSLPLCEKLNLECKTINQRTFPAHLFLDKYWNTPITKTFACHVAAFEVPKTMKFFLAGTYIWNLKCFAISLAFKLGFFKFWNNFFSNTHNDNSYKVLLTTALKCFT